MPDSSDYRTPRWVKVFALVVAGLALAFLVVMLLGIGGPHGPGRHLPAAPPQAENP